MSVYDQPDVTCPAGHPMCLRHSRHGPFWGCTQYPDCKHTHGAHPDGQPLGKPAGPVVKAARISAHQAFDRIWKGNDAAMTRTDAYAWLARELALEAHRCHIGRFDLGRCRRVVQVCEAKAAAHRVDLEASARRELDARDQRRDRVISDREVDRS